ncbi:hypothetical protein Tco_0758148 [Tanacetum coccineum]
MVLPDNPMGSLDNVLDNQIFETSSNDSHLSNVEMYLNDEEDDGDSMVIPKTPSEKTRIRIDNNSCSQEHREGNALDPWIPALEQGGMI